MKQVEKTRGNKMKKNMTQFTLRANEFNAEANPKNKLIHRVLGAVGLSWIPNSLAL